MTVMLVDVRCMYVSCERAWDPGLDNVPVVVLSNNDGCVVSRSDDAKALDIPMGKPWFEIREEARRRPALSAVVYRSSNYELYGDMSARFHATLATLSAQLELYSIDECFLRVPSLVEPTEFARAIQDRVWSWTGLPVSIGIGPTKTLAKQAQHWAKAQPSTGGIGDITRWSPERLREGLAATPVSDVWGVGPRLTRALAQIGITTAAHLAGADHGMIRRRHSVVLERTARELAGTPCIPVGYSPPARAQVMHARLLGAPVTTRAEMRAVLTAYAERAARRLRRHGMSAALLTATLSSSRYRHAPQHHAITAPLSPPTDSGRLIAVKAYPVLERMIEGHPYNEPGSC